MLLKLTGHNFENIENNKQFNYWLKKATTLPEIKKATVNDKSADYNAAHFITIVPYDGINFFFNFCGGTLGTAATTGLLYQPRMIGEGDCSEIGGMKIGRGNRSTWRKPAPAPLYMTV
jgi:hypothetical protein